MPYGWLRNGALGDPLRPALVHEGLVVTYGELLQATRGLVAVLRGWGVGAGDRVGVQLGKTPEFVAAVCAIDGAGGAALLLDTALTPGEVDDYSSRAGAAFVLSGSDTPADASSGPARRAVPPLAELARLAGGQGDAEGIGRADPDSYLLMLMSSGTTGRPKIVPKTRRKLHTLIRSLSAAIPLHPDDRVLMTLPLFHASGLFKGVMAALAHGCTLYLEPFSPRATAHTIERAGITVLFGAPFIYNALLETEFSTRPDFSTLRLVASGTAAQSRDVMREFHRRFGVRMSLSYGCTECGSTTFGLPPTDDPAPGWVGWPLPGLTVEIRGPDGVCIPSGEEGSIVVRSPAASTCYLGAPAATAAKFQDGCVMTGDIGRLTPDGALCLTGRQKDMISVAGKKVAPSEVEAVLRLHPQVSEALVLPGRSEDGSEMVEAYVEAREPLTPGALRAFCGPRLAAFKVPRRFRVVERLPRSATGKLVRRAPGPDGSAGG
jgi:long-chain acyl-CoA synthetase